MKVRLFVYAVIATLFSSCAIPEMQHEMINNNFMDVSPVPTNFTGTWTGTFGPFLTTLQIFSDGNGRNCYLNNNGVATTHKIKIYETTDSGLKMIEETGIRNIVSKAPDNSIIINTHGDKHTMKEDPDMEHANFDCKTKLKSLL